MSSKSIDLRSLRENYTMAELSEEQVHEDPIIQFDLWMQAAIHAAVPEPNAMTLATISAAGFPESRVVLLKEVEQGSFVFYTNYASAKGRQMAANPRVSLTFLWIELQRQVRVVGYASKVLPEVSDAYFESRPRGSQIGAWVSPQSEVVSERTVLDKRHKDYEQKFAAVEIIPRPPHWGGYGVEPLSIEFWQGRASRLHDRILYTKNDEKWAVSRLAP